MIVQSNFLTDGGVVHKIAGYIHPNLRTCDVINRTVVHVCIIVIIFCVLCIFLGFLIKWNCMLYFFFL